MVTILIGVCCFFCTGILLFILANSMYKKTNDYKNRCIDIKSYMDGIPYDIQMANLGSTYAKYAFSGAADLRINTCDFSLQSQSLEMDSVILHQYIDHMAEGCVVVIVVAACLLLYRKNGDNPLYYYILKDRQNPYYTPTGKIKSVFPILAAPKRIIRILIDVAPYRDIYDSMPVCMSDAGSKKELEGLVAIWKQLFHLKRVRGQSGIIRNI